MPKVIVCLTIMLYLGLVFTAEAQSLFHHHYTQEHGLSDNIIYHMLNDREGALWIGSDNGLNHFDGQSFKNYYREDSLSSDFVIAMDTTSEGALWIATWRGGACRLDSVGIQVIPSNAPNALMANIRFLSDTSFFAWNRSWGYHCSQYKDSLVCRKNFLHRDQVKLVMLPKKSLGEYHFLNETNYHIHGNELWLYGSFPGLVRYVNDTTLLPIEHKLFGKDTINVIHQGSNGTYWLGVKGKLIRWSRQGLKIYTKNLEGLNLYSIKEISENSLFISTAPPPFFGKRKVLYYEVETGRCIPFSDFLPIKNAIAEIHLDQGKNLWIGTDGDGLFQVPYPYLIHLQGSDVAKSVVALHKTQQGQVYIGTKFNSYSINQSSDFQMLERKTQQGVINGIHSFHDGRPIITTSNGLYVNDVLLFNGFTRGAIPYGKNHVVFWSSNSISVLNVDSAQQQQRYLLYEATAHSVIQQCFIDDEGQLWVASNDGLLKFDISFLMRQWETDRKNTQKLSTPLPITSITKKEGLDDSNVLSLCAAPTGGLWLLTRQGLSHYQQGKVTAFANHLAQIGKTKYQSMTVDNNGIVWIGSNDGLYFFDGSRFGIFTLKHGLPHGAVNSLLVDNQNQLWIGSQKGVSIINVSNKPMVASSPTSYIAKVLVSGIEVTERPISMTYEDNIMLKFKTNTAYTNEGLTYRVQLNDADWQVINQPEVMYSDLRAGKYQAKMGAKKSDSDWGQSQTIDFEVHPPWWGRWWVFFIEALLFIAVVLGLYFWVEQRKRNKENARAMLDKKIAELELKTLQAQLNPHFIFNALNSIQRYTLDQDAVMANRYLTQFSHLMRLFLESSASKFITLEEEIELLEIYVGLEKLRFSDSFTYTIYKDESLCENLFIPSMLIQPFVENAINHGLLHNEDEGKLSVSFTRMHEGMIACIIDDNGVGRKKALEIKKSSTNAYKSRALQITQEKLKAINTIEGLYIHVNTIDKLDAQGMALGTTVEIHIPIEV